MKIELYQRCQCGAITLYFENGDSNSLKEENLTAFGVDISDIEQLQDCYYCNHCVNHYGLDICSCGSGEQIGECECGSDCAREYYGQSVPFMPRF